MKKVVEFKTLDEISFVQVGKCYRCGNQFVRIDFKDENGDLYGVDFYSQEEFMTISVNVSLCDPVSESDVVEITENEFYKALDLLKEDFERKFRAVKSGIL